MRIAEDKSKFSWYEERHVQDHKFKCALTMDNRLIISALIADTNEYPVATFYCNIKNKVELEEALSIITRLRERSSLMLDK